MIFLQFLCPNYEYCIACYYRWLVNLYKHLFLYLHYHNQWLGTQEASNMPYFFHAVDLWLSACSSFASLVDIIVPYSHCFLLVIFSILNVTVGVWVYSFTVFIFFTIHGCYLYHVANNHELSLLLACFRWSSKDLYCFVVLSSISSCIF